VEQLGAAGRTEGVESRTDLTLELLEVHGIGRTEPGSRSLLGHGVDGVLEDLTLATCRH
jgi:hypothetical protein